MKASALMFELRNIINTHGDLPIVGGYLMDDSPLRIIELVDKDGLNAKLEKTKPVGIFLTQ